MSTGVEIRYSYKPVPTIRAFSESNSFIRGLMGPFGSGKSSGCVVEIVRRAHAQAPGPDGVRRSRWAAIRNTYRQLEDTTIRTVLDWLPEGAFGVYRKTDHVYEVTGFDGVKFEIWFRALDRPEHIANLLSAEFTGAWVNEAREVPETIINALKGRVGRYPSMRDGGPTWSGIFMDTNPPDNDSWWYRLFEETKPEGIRLFRQPSGVSADAENRANLVPAYYDNLCAGASEDFVKVYVKGEYGFVNDGKPVYPEYVDSMHCSEAADYNPKLPVVRGWDFGLTPSCLFSQRTPDGRWLTFDELNGDSIGIDKFSDEVIARSADYGKDFEDWADPAGNQRSQTDEKTCYEILRGKGIAVAASDQDVQIRVESVKRGLNMLIAGKPALLIHPRCKTLRKGYQGRYRYRRLQVSAERFTDVPEKNDYSHPHDANQYVAAKIFGPLVKAQVVKSKPIDYSKLNKAIH